MKNEFKIRQNIDGMLVNVNIPLLIFAIGIIINFNSLFDIQNKETPLFYKIIFIILIWLILLVVVNIFIYLINEILILHNANLTLKNKVYIMKRNFEFTFFLCKFILLIILTMLIYLYTLKITDLNSIVLNNIIKNFFSDTTFIIVLILVISILIICFVIKLVFNFKIFKKMKISTKYYYFNKFFHTFLSLAISFSIIFCFLYFNNSRNIDIYFNKNGLVKVCCDFDIDNSNIFNFKLDKNNLYPISEFKMNERLSYIDVHLGNESKVATKSALDRLINNEGISPITLYGFSSNNSYYIDLNKILNMHSALNVENKDFYSIEIDFNMKKHSYSVRNQFVLFSNNFEFAKESANLRFHQIDLFD